MAGLAEFFTPVASSLFWTEISIKISESSTVTDRAAYWVAPSNPSYLQPQKKQKQKTKKTKKKQNKTKKQKQNKKKNPAKFSIVFKRINIWIKVRRKKKINVKERLVSKPTQDELYEFLSGLNQTEKKPGIL